MRISTNEAKLLCVLLANAPAGEPVAVAPLAVFFERPCECVG